MNNFKRNIKPPVEVNWNPAKGTFEPFEKVLDGIHSPVTFRGKKVVTMDGEYFQVTRSWYDFHPYNENGAILAPLSSF